MAFRVVDFSTNITDADASDGVIVVDGLRITVTANGAWTLTLANGQLNFSEDPAFGSEQFRIDIRPASGNQLQYNDFNATYSGSPAADGGFPSSLQIDSVSSISPFSYSGSFDYSSAGFGTSALVSQITIIDNKATANSVNPTSSFTLDNLSIDDSFPPANIAPTISNFSGPADNVTYTEGDGTVIVDQGSLAVVSDPDSSGWTGGFLRFGNALANQPADDSYGIRNQGTGSQQIGVSGTTVSYGGVAFATIDGTNNGSGGTDLWVSLTSAATDEMVTALVHNLTYANASENPTTGSRTLFLSISDGDPNGTSVQNLTLTVNAVNDAPTISAPASISIPEDGGDNIQGIAFTDLDSGNSIVTVTLSATSGTFAGTSGDGVTFGGVGTSTLTMTGTVANINARLQGFGPPTPVYDPPADLDTDVALTVTINDGGASGSGGAEQAQTTITLDLQPSNDAPSINSGTIEFAPGITEDDNVVRSVSDLVTAAGFSDPDTGSGRGMVVIGEEGQFEYSTNGGATWHQVSTGGTVSAPLFSGSTLIRYVPGEGAGAGRLTFQAWDETGFTATSGASVTLVNLAITGVGGTTPFSSAFSAAEVSVTAVNDPVGTIAPGAVSLPEDTVDYAVTGMAISDLDAAMAPNGVYEVSLSATRGLLTLTTLNGLTFTAGDGVSDAAMTFHGTLAAINTALATAKYTPDANYSGFDPQGIVLQARDEFGGVVATGSGAATSDANFINVTVRPVNDAPSGADRTVSITEDTAYTVATSDFGFSDSVEGDALTAAKISTVTNGTLTVGGATVSAGDSVAVADIDAGRLVFTLATDVSGVAAASFTFQVVDNGGTSDGGVDTDPVARSFLFDVSGVNDAPVLTPAAPALTSISEDDLATAGESVASILGGSVTEVDAGALQGVAVVAQGGNGTWQYALFDGVAFGAWTSVGAVAADRALLLNADDKLRFVPDGLNGTAASLTYHAWDQTSGLHGTSVDLSTPGATGGITAFSVATDTASLLVTNVNDAPGAVADGGYQVGRNETLSVAAGTGLLANDTDIDLPPDALAVNLASIGPLLLTPAPGTPAPVGTGTLLVNADGSFSYTPPANFVGTASFSYRANDGTNDSIAAASVTITVFETFGVSTEGSGGAEFLTGGEGAADVINGGDGGDFIQGLSGSDQLNGENGDDVLYGGAGDDLVAGGFGNDVLIGGEGRDQMHGEVGSDQLFGGGGQDDLRGGDGADFLSGGEGAFDFLSGGAGGDRFIITDTPSGTKEGTIDALLLDFSFAEGDRLDLGGVPGGGAGVLFTASDGFGFGPSTLVTLANGTQFVIVGQGVSDVQAGFASWVV